MASDFFFEDLTLWNPDGQDENVCVLVKKGVIEKIAPRDAFTESDLLAVEMRPGRGTHLIPAGVDEQVHLRVPGQPEKEIPEMALEAAAFGGFGAVLSMPNTKPPIDNIETLERARRECEKAANHFGVQVLFTACLTEKMEGRRAVDFPALMRAGVTHFTDDGLGVASTELMDEIFAASAQFGFTILQHAEMPGHLGVLAPGPVQKKLGINAYSEEAEVEMVRRDLECLRKHPGGRYHVLHVSSAKTLDLVCEARSGGLHVSCEVTPHHLLFTSDDVEEGKTAYKMNPPLRTLKDRDRLREALEKGEIDFVATDHAPHEAALKGPDFSRAAFGTTGMEVALRVLLALWEGRLLSAQRLVQVFSSRPAEFLGIATEFGSLRVGRPFRAVWVGDLQEKRPVAVSDLKSLSKNSCFLGQNLPGRVLAFYGRSGEISF